MSVHTTLFPDSHTRLIRKRSGTTGFSGRIPYGKDKTDNISRMSRFRHEVCNY